MKICSICKEKECYKSGNTYRSLCKDCKNKKEKDRYYKNNIRRYVKCEAKLSDDCFGMFAIYQPNLLDNIKKNNGKVICFNCKRKLTHVGNKNGNKKYNFDEHYFEFIDSEYKAYFLGLIASDGSVRKSNFTISLQENDYLILEQLRDLLNKDMPISHRKKTGMKSLTVNSIIMANDICKHLKIKPGKKSHTVSMPDLPVDLSIHFIRGYFDGDGGIRSIHQNRKGWPRPECSISSSSPEMRNKIKEIIKIPCYDDGKINLTWGGNNALDLLSLLYDGANIFLNRKRDLYLDWSIWEPGLSGTQKQEALFRYIKTEKNAVKPSKVRASDSGYDLTVIKKDKEVGNLVFYDTCVKVQPIYGYYFDLVPRSSMPKTGYILANSIGIIDRTYVGPIKVCLIKIDKNAPDLELPAKIVQIIPRPIIHCEFIEQDFEETNRGSGGFGSTNK